MRVTFVNIPFVYSEHSSPENNFRFDGILPEKQYYTDAKFRAFVNLYNHEFKARFGVRAGSRWPWTSAVPTFGISPFPFFMAYAAANVQRAGHEVTLLDAVAMGECSYPKFLQTVKNTAPDIVVIETSTPTIDIDIWFAEKVSYFAEVCLAGPHVTYAGEKILEQYPFIQYVLKGEYAKNCLTMLRERKRRVYDYEYIRDWDELPFAFRDYPNSDNYYDPTVIQPRPEIQLYGSKGCPFHCVYCMWPQVMYGGAYTPREPKQVVAEIRENLSKVAYKSIFFDDDTFNIGTERVSALCDELAKLGLPWSMMGRLDTSPEWLFDKMVDCGCVGMRFGVETFDKQVSKNIKKGLQRDNIYKTLAYITSRHPDLQIHLTMMKNLPGQTQEIHQRDLQILNDLGYDMNSPIRNYQMASVAPFPGTELYRQLKAQGLANLDDWKRYDGSLKTFELGDMK